MIFQSENNYYFLCKSIENGKPVVQLYKSPSRENKNGELLASQPLTTTKPLYLKIESKASTYAFYFGEKKNKWKLLKDGVDASFLSTKVAGGFVGVYLHCMAHPMERQLHLLQLMIGLNTRAMMTE